MRAGSSRLYLRGKTWWCWGQDARGKRWYASTHQQDIKAAERAAKTIERERVDAVHVPPPGKTLANAVHALRAALVRGDRAAATSEFYERKLGHLVRILGPDRILASLTAIDLEGYVDQRRSEGVGRSTAAKELNALQTAAKRVSVSLAPFPPELRGAYLPRTRWLPVPEYKALLAALSPDRRRYVEAWCITGLRESELYSLETSDLTAEGLVVRGTKNRGARRMLPLTADLRLALAPPYPRWLSVRRDLRAACKRAGIMPVSPNDFRRTFASWLAQGGVPLIHAIRLMGHGSSQMLTKVYAQLSPEAKQAAMQAVTDLVTHAGPKDANSALPARKKRET